MHIKKQAHLEMEINYAHSEVKLFTEKSMATDNMACKIVIFSPIIYKP